MKRLFALLLALALLLPVMTAFAAPPAGEQSLWEQILTYENDRLRITRGKAVTASDYAALSADIAEMVMASDDYTEGTCTYDGTNAAFFWEDADGEPQGYLPSLRAKIKNGANGVDPASVGETVTMSYAEKGGSPNAQNVYVIGPWYGSDDSFTNQYKNEGQSIAKAIGGNYTLYSGTSATINNVAKAMEEGAVVIFDSHGVTDYDEPLSYTYPDDRYSYVYDSVTGAHTSYLTLTTGTGLTTADKAKVTDEKGTYYHASSFLSDSGMVYCVDGTVIANHMTKNAPNSMLWMAICLGMATDGICKPLRGKGVEVVYGYSQSITFDGDYAYEADFWTQMKNGSTVADAVATMKRNNANWDPAYYAAGTYYNTVAKAQRYFVAFPVVVSSEDTHPGRRTGSGNYGADNLQTVNATWRLLSHTTHTTEYCEAKAPSCTEAGNIAYYRCTGCGKYFSDEAALHELTAQQLVVPAEGHKPVADPEKPATCTQTGLTAGSHCEICGTVLTEQKTVKALGHELTDWRLSLAPTCTADGEQKRTCSRCDFVETKTISKLGHEMTDWEVALAPTCTAEGQRERHCIRCDRKETESIPKLDCPSERYRDVEKTAWYHDAVDFAVANGIMNGVSDTSFVPNDKLTRAMLATILYRMDGDEGSYEHPFTDLEEGSWYNKAVAWAYACGVINGASATTFSPNENVTREQAAAMLYRYAAYCGDDTDASGSLSAFRDADQISAYALKPMQWAVGRQILNGKGDGILDPTGTATRAEITKIIMKWAQ